MRLEQIKSMNQETEAKLELCKKRGRCVYRTALVYCITFAILITTAYISIIILKNHFIKKDSLSFGRALTSDSIQLFVYLVLILTLTGTLVYFGYLERRHKMKIRKL